MPNSKDAQKVPAEDPTPQPPLAAPAPAPPPPKVAPPPKPQQSHPHPPPNTTQTISMLNSRHMREFLRQDSDYHIINVIVDIDAQDTLSGLVYDHLTTLHPVDLPLNRDGFIRMWKSLILKRVQDIIEKQRLSRPQHFIRLSRNVTLPAPLADLLYTLGQFHSPAKGIKYDITQPPRPAVPEQWWNIDDALLPQWITTMGLLADKYIMREYPSQSEYSNRPITLTMLMDNEDGTIRSVKSATNETSLNDAFIHFVNDPLFLPIQGMAYARCHLKVVDSLHLLTIRRQYVRGYTTNTD